MKDFIIVGRGLAAACLMHQFQRAGLTFSVLGDPGLSRSSRVAAGIWNPVVFKRLTKSWMADELVPYLLRFYRDAEQLTGRKFVHERHIIRVFTEDQEESLWLKKCRNEMDDYLDQRVYGSAEAPGNTVIAGRFSKVLNAGNLDINEFLDATEDLFRTDVHDETFRYPELQISEGQVAYREFQARNIVFCEGWLVKENLYFSWVPLKPAKGEVLTLDMPGFDCGSDILNRGSFLFRTEGNTFRTGATYEWEQLDETPTEAARAELLDKLQSHTGASFTLVKHEAAVRPASSDRRPVIGPHPEHHNVYIFNGLGTKGVMIAPFFSEKFVNFYLQTGSLPPEVAVQRFRHLYERKA